MNYYHKIIKETLPMLLAAALLATLGGINLKSVETHLTYFLPLFLMLPALNATAGEIGIVLVSKITTHLYEYHNKKINWKTLYIHHLFKNMLIVSIISSFYLSMLSLFLAGIRGYELTSFIVIQTLLITFIVIITLFILTFFIALTFGFYAYKHNTDPDDLLIPIVTSLADLGSMSMLALLLHII
ncbi:MAG TPA: magnesium transporter [Candidatus Nanoarchaeia archaeon]|nr:magnesium transporter [Candidatus Nanoarchaeia archaeon]